MKLLYVHNYMYVVLLVVQMITIILSPYNIIIIFYHLYIIKQWGQTAIYTASAEGHIETVKVLLQAKANTEIQHTVNAFSSQGKIFLLFANSVTVFLVKLLH